MTPPARPGPWRDWVARRPPFAGVHLNSAAAGRTSFAVQLAVTDHLDQESRQGAYVAQAEAEAVIARARADLGALLAIPADGIAFVESATAAMVALLTAWPLPEGASVGVAPSEWGPNLRALRMRGLEIRTLPVDGDGRLDLDALPRLLKTDPPGLVHITAVAAHRGLVQPVTDIATICRSAGVPLWVDAAQALGHIDSAFGADAIYATSRKWLGGPRGVGVLAVAPPWWPRLRVEPLVLSPDDPVVARLESGEANIAGRIGLAVAIREYLDDGPASVVARLDALGAMAGAALADVRGWRVLARRSGAGAIVAIEPTAGQDVAAERDRLAADHRILVTASAPARAPLEMTQPSLRISPHVDATEAQLDALIDALAR